MSKKKVSQEVQVVIPKIPFSQEVEKMAIKLAAYHIMKQLYLDGKITKDELQYISIKHNICVEEK